MGPNQRGPYRFLESLMVIYARDFDDHAGLRDGEGRADGVVVVVVVLVKGEGEGNQDKEPLAPDSERHCTGPSGDQKLKTYFHCPGIVPI